MHNKDVRSYSCAHKTSLNTFELTGHQQVLQLIAKLEGINDGNDDDCCYLYDDDGRYLDSDGYIVSGYSK